MRKSTAAKIASTQLARSASKPDLEAQISTLDEEMVYLRNELAFQTAKARAWEKGFESIAKMFTDADARADVRFARRTVKKEIADAI